MLKWPGGDQLQVSCTRLKNHRSLPMEVPGRLPLGDAFAIDVPTQTHGCLLKIFHGRVATL